MFFQPAVSFRSVCFFFSALRPLAPASRDQSTSESVYVIGGQEEEEEGGGWGGQSEEKNVDFEGGRGSVVSPGLRQENSDNNKPPRREKEKVVSCVRVLLL